MCDQTESHQGIYAALHATVSLLSPTHVLFCTQLRLTSGTPPTAVETTMRPAAAASTMAMQKASVRDALMKMSPLTYT